jgi:8-oxo-dGTP pyrophosphatase MutT (NUDIX family)
MSTARVVSLVPARIPLVLYATVRREDAERAVRRGVLSGPKRTPVALFDRLEAASPFDCGKNIHLKIDAASAAAEGVEFSGRGGGFWYASGLPLRFAGLLRAGQPLVDITRLECAGGVVLRAGKVPRVLLLRKGRGRGARWVLPKGRKRPGEALEETAAREVLEETGLASVVVQGELSQQEYFDEWHGRTVIKRVTFFLMHCEQPGAGLRVRRKEGFTKGRWVTFDDALALTAPSRAHRALRAARAVVSGHGRSRCFECA